MRVEKTKREQQGFTLAELLCVVGIIAVLVAVAIPVFTASTEKAEQAVCASHRKQIEDMYIITRMTDTSSTSDALLSAAAKSVLGEDAGCPTEGSRYSYEFYTADGHVTAAGNNDAEYIEVICSIDGHGSTTLQRAQMRISEWISQYEEKHGMPVNTDGVIRKYLIDNGGSYAMTQDDYKEIFGDRKIAQAYDYNANQQLYLRPMGVRVNGELQDVQYVSRWDGYAGNGSYKENIRTYAVIVDGKVYASCNANNEIQGPAHLSGTYVYDIANTNFSSIDAFIAAITKSGQFKQIN